MAAQATGVAGWSRATAGGAGRWPAGAELGSGDEWLRA